MQKKIRVKDLKPGDILLLRTDEYEWISRPVLISYEESEGVKEIVLDDGLKRIFPSDHEVFVA